MTAITAGLAFAPFGHGDRNGELLERDRPWSVTEGPVTTAPLSLRSYGRWERPELAWGAGVAGSGGGVEWVPDCPALALAIELTKAP